jgi:hypothetical protein
MPRPRPSAAVLPTLFPILYHGAPFAGTLLSAALTVDVARSNVYISARERENNPRLVAGEINKNIILITSTMEDTAMHARAVGSRDALARASRSALLSDWLFSIVCAISLREQRQGTVFSADAYAERPGALPAREIFS